MCCRCGCDGLVAHLALEVGVFLLVLVGGAPLPNPRMRDLPESALAGLLAVTLMLGLVLTAIAFLRAGIYPRWVGVLWVGACLTFFLSFFGDIFPDSVQRVLGTVSGALFGTPFTLAQVCLGVVAWQRASRQAAGV